MPGTCETIRINKPTNLRVIIPTLEVIQPRLGIVVVSPIPDRIQVPDAGGGAIGCVENFAPGVVGVGSSSITGGIQDLHNVALEVGDVVIPGLSGRRSAGIPHQEREGRAGFVVEEFQLGIAVLFRNQFATLPGVPVDLRSHGLCQPQAVGIVGEADRGMVIGGADGRQPPAISPGHRRPVVPGGGVANGVVGDGVPVVGRQQVPTTGKMWDKEPSPVPLP